jgi:hypothetical protein
VAKRVPPARGSLKQNAVLLRQLQRFEQEGHGFLVRQCPWCVSARLGMVEHVMGSTELPS